MTHRHLRGFALAASLLFLTLAAACGGSDDTADGDSGASEGDPTSTAGGDRQFGAVTVARSGGGNTETVDIDLAPAAQTVDAATVQSALIDADRDTGEYRLDSDAADNIEVGSVVLFEEHSLVRILDKRDDGGDVVLMTEPAPLNEYISDGELGWDYAIDFGGSQTNWLDGMTVFLGPYQLQPAERSEAAIKFKGEIGSMEVEVEIAPSGERLQLSLDATKSIDGGPSLQIVASGWVEGFRSTGNVSYAGGDLQSFRYQNQELKSEMDIRFVGVRLGQQPEILNLPLRLDMPFVVYGIPMKLALGANLSIVPELTGESSSEVAFNVKYSGSEGFEWSQTSARALGGLDNQVLELTTGDTAGFVPVGLGVTLAFPVMQLSILHGTVVPSMVIDTHISGFYSPNPACQSASVRLRGVVGVSLGVLGLELASAQETVFEKEHEVAPGEECVAFESND
ncbi:MAG: hypothetical protein HOH95_11295 [Dehalococcoidia bacterium]|jgi:hypothetical protein|nr:hypothetical protein [Dehalococcoidia bacterium]